MIDEKMFFDREIYSEDYEYNFDFDKDLLKKILKKKRTGKVLDVGCGEAGLSLKLAEHGFEVTCIDISPKAAKAVLSEASKRKVNIRFLTEDVESVDFTGKRFDVVLLMGVLHFLEGDVKKFVGLMKNITNKNGLHVVDVLLSGSNAAEDSEGYYFQPGEIKEFYREWNIVNSELYEEEKDKFEFLIAEKP